MSRYSRRIIPVIAAVLLAGTLAMPMPARAAQAPVLLGTTEQFAVLAGSAITNTGPTTISGDAGANVGIYPGTSITGTGSITLAPGGDYHIADGVAQVAKNDLVTAYNDAAGRLPVTRIPTELGGQTLSPGVYDSASGTFGITGTLTLDAGGDPDGVFIFLTQSTLITASSSVVSLINGARYCRVFWQVGSSATLGTDSTFVGHIFAMTSITANTRAFIQGQLLARNGAVTLDTNTIINGLCPPVASPTPVVTGTPGPTASPSPTPAGTGTPGPTASPSPTPAGTATPGPTGTPGPTVSPTTLPPTGDNTTGITTLGIIAMCTGLAFVLAGIYLHLIRQKKTKS